MRNLCIFITALVLCVITTAHAAPTLFNNVMAFDNHNFGLIDFETGQSSYSEVDTYLTTYGAQLVGGDFATPYHTASIKATTTYVTATHGLVGDGGIITVHFNTPVYAAGIFLCRMGHDKNEDPYTYGRGTNIKVTYGNGSTVIYDFNEILTAGVLINGFFGVMDLEDGITEFECVWSRDTANVDDLYFGNNVTTSIDLLGGPTNTVLANFSLPTFNGSESFGGPIPEPGTILLLGMGIAGIIRKYFCS